MPESDIYVNLTEIFKDVFYPDDISLSPQLTAKDVNGWDSFKHVEIIMAVEERFNIKLSSKELDQLSSVGNLVELILKKTEPSRN